ncbi:MAG: hypothetical protein AAGE59_04995 [Cyanobacteria bacterium P01_F01_bin.86]
MTAISSDQITGTIAIHVQPQANGAYVCQLSPDLSNASREAICCYGQSKEHAIAIALEQLASTYRQIAEEQQETSWDEVERSPSGESIDRCFHVILHYERIAEEASKFEAMHNTITGNTVIENAQITVIEIKSDLAVKPIVRT